MHLAEPDDDDTIRLHRPPPSVARQPRAGGARLARAACLLLALGGGGVAVALLYPRSHPPPPRPAIVVPPAVVAPPAAIAPPAAAAAPAFTLVTADEAAIRDHVSDTLSVFRFAADPRIVVLDFAALRQQGEMLNRVAALVEKAGLPRDRVLTDAELAAAIRASGDTVESFYYGHDYPAAAIVRFFALADAAGIGLDAEETRLRALARQLGWFTGAADGALISIPRAGAAAELDMAARATMLHHELSHGVFFTDAAYAAYVRGFWEGALTEAERAGVRKFLGAEGYDTADETLMLNEMQAYVMFTADPRFFQPANIGITAARRAALAAAFRQGMPPLWLRDALVVPCGRPPCGAMGVSP